MTQIHRQSRSDVEGKGPTASFIQTRKPFWFQFFFGKVNLFLPLPLSLSKKRSTTQASHIRRATTGAPRYAGPPPPEPPSIDPPTTTDAAPRFSRLPPTHHTWHHHDLLSSLSPTPLSSHHHQRETPNPPLPPPSLLSRRYLSLTSLPAKPATRKKLDFFFQIS